MTFFETLKKRWYVLIAVLGFVILLTWFGIISLPGAQSNHLSMRVGDEKIMTVIVYDETSKADLSSFNVQKPEELQIPSNINKFDVVTFNHTLLNNQLKSGKSFIISFGGKDYQTEISRMNFENIDDGIDSFHGKLVGINYSDIMFTTSEKSLTGRVTGEDGIYWITPVEPGLRIENSSSPLHIIYNSRNVRDEHFKID